MCMDCSNWLSLCIDSVFAKYFVFCILYLCMDCNNTENIRHNGWSRSTLCVYRSSGWADVWSSGRKTVRQLPTNRFQIPGKETPTSTIIHTNSRTYPFSTTLYLRDNAHFFDLPLGRKPSNDTDCNHFVQMLRVIHYKSYTLSWWMTPIAITLYEYYKQCCRFSRNTA